MKRGLGFVFTAVVLSLAACGGDPAAEVTKHIARGDDFASRKSWREAALEYGAAVKVNPRSAGAQQKLGLAYLQVGDSMRGCQHLANAADLAPADTAIQLQTGRCLLVIGRFEDAKGRAETVLATDSRNAEALTVKGLALAGLRELDSALTAVQSAIAADPTRSSIYRQLGALQYAKGDLTQAEGALKRAVAVDPKSLAARLALANLYWSTNRKSQAEVLLKEAAALDPSSAVPNQALAMLYFGMGRMKDAESPLKALAERNADGKLMLADYYVNVRRMEDAKTLYNQVAEGADGATTAKLRLASLGMLEKNHDSARKLIENVLAKEPKNVDALIAKAKLEFADGKAKDAVVTARAAIAANPEAAFAHYVLGEVLFDQQQLDDAEKEFKETLRLSGFAPANFQLAKLCLDQGRYEDGVKYAQAAIDKVPGYADAYVLVARGQIATGNLAAAEKAINVLVANFPDSPIVQAEVGRLLLQKGDLARARSAFERALAGGPNLVAALEGMVSVELRSNQTANARRRLDAAVAAGQRNSSLQVTAARLYYSAFSDLPAAEAAARRAIDADSDNFQAMGVLAEIYVRQNKLAAATAEFEKLALRQPKSLVHPTMVGLLYQVQGQVPKAEAAYLRALAIDSKAPVASNNLAQLYLDSGNRFDEALQLAQTAKTGLPKAHEVDDTLGWAYFKKGLAPSAISSLKLAVAAQPANATYLFHLGAAYALSGDRGQARQLLQKALSIGNFPESEDARRILSEVK